MITFTSHSTLFASPYMCRNSSLRLAPDDPEIESLLGRDFLHPSGLALGHTQPSIQSVPDLFPGGKAAGALRYPPTPTWHLG